MPNVEVAYWYLSCLTAQLALIAYIIFFIAAIKLRIKNTWNKQKEYVFAPTYLSVSLYAIGAIGSFIGLFAGFMLPGDTTMPLWKFNAMLAAGIIIICAIPITVMIIRKNRSSQRNLIKVEIV